MLLLQQGFGQFFMPPSGNFDHIFQPTLLWKFKANGSIVSSPIIDNGIVFIGSLDSALYALDLETGKTKWKFPTAGPIRSSVCIAKQKLFLLSTDGLLYRMEKDSGKVDGYFQTMTGYIGDGQKDYADYFTSTPVIEDSTIYFGSGDYVYAISVTDGNIKWTYKTGDAVHTRPAISKGRVFVGSFDGHLYSFDSKNGNLIWKFKTTGRYSFPKGEVTGNPVVAGGMVFAGARDNNLYALDVRGGYCNWLKSFPFGWALPITANDTALYVGTSDDLQLIALDIRSGGEMWRFDAGFNIFSGVCFGKTIGCFGTLAGKVTGIDLTKGEEKWTLELDSYVKNRSKYFKEDGSYRADIGKVLRNPSDVLKMYAELGGVFGTPASSEDKIVVAGYDGWVYCFGAGPKK